MTLKGNPEPAKAAVREVLAYALANPATVTINGNNSPAKDAINELNGMTVTVNVAIESGALGGAVTRAVYRKYGISSASGAIVRSYANASSSRSISPGLALTGEEGPEIIWNKSMGYAYIVGKNHPQFTNLQPGDRVFNANDTRKILNYDQPKSNWSSSVIDPSMMEDPLFGSFAGGSAYGSYGPQSKYNSGGSGGSGKNKKTKEFDPERYHLITRQLADIIRYYERLNKIKEKAFGKNKIKAIEDEIEATNELIKAQQALIDEANKYLDQDLKRLKDYGVSFTLDVNGNIENWDELQEKYGRAAAETEDEDARKRYTDIWKAIQQYEETIDKIHEAEEGMNDYIFQLQELQLEKITAEVEMKIEYDDKSLDFLQHFIDKLEDDIYATADALTLTGAQIDTISNKLNTARAGIEGIMKGLHDQYGNLIEDMTLEKFMSLTDEERDNLLANSEDMEAVVDYLEQMKDLTEDLADKKTFGLERIKLAFEELSGSVTKQIDIFNHYKNLLDSIKNISGLLGQGVNPETQRILNQVNNNILKNTKNNLQAQQDYYKALTNSVEQMRTLLANETDQDLIRAYREELDELEEAQRDAQEQMLSYWEEGLEQAQEIFNTHIEQIIANYEKAIAGIYSTIQALEDTYNRNKEIRQQYLDDYEKYYELSKLQRNLNKTIDELSINGNKYQKALKGLLNDVIKLQKDGTKISDYDLEVLQKKYEIEKARAELEDARNAKSTVRLQRNTNGTWGYVYTADEDKIADLEQRYEDAIYNYQKLNDEHIYQLQESIFSLEEEYKNLVQEVMSDITLSQEEKLLRLQELSDEYYTRQEFLFDQFSTALENQSGTFGRAVDIYEGKISELGDAFVDLQDVYNETILSQITGVQELSEFKDQLLYNWEELLQKVKEELQEYSNNIEWLNNQAGMSTENFVEQTTAMIESIDQASVQTSNDVAMLSDEFSTMFKIISEEATAFESQWLKMINSLIGETEPFITLMNGANDLAEAYEVGVASSNKQMDINNLASFQNLTDTASEILANPNTVDLQSLLNAIDIQAMRMGFGLGAQFNAPYTDTLGQVIEQQVTITAEFPNATDHYEIEQAFNNLVNKATQYANEKRNG